MKRALWTAAAITAAAHANALPLGSCYRSYVDLQKQVIAEGQSILVTSADSRTIVTTGAQDSGYVIQAKGREWCVASVLQKVKTISSQSQTEDLCEQPAKYPGAVAACNELKSSGRRVTRSVSADAERPALSPKNDGPVKVTLALCREAGRDVLCARTETLIQAK